MATPRPHGRTLTLAVATAGGAALLAAVMPRLIREWMQNDNCGHVAVALPVGLGLLAWRLRNGQDGGRPSWLAPAALTLGALFMTAERWLSEPTLLAAGLWCGGVGVLTLLRPGRSLGPLVAPLILLAACVPPPQAVTQLAVHHQLQTLTAGCSAGLLSMLGSEVTAEGTALHTGGGVLEVAEPCSGYRFLVAMLLTAVVLIDLRRIRGLWAWGVVLGAAGATAVMVNVVRIAAAAVVARAEGLDAAVAFLHGPIVLVIYLGGAGLLGAATMNLRPRGELRIEAPKHTPLGVAT